MLINQEIFIHPTAAAAVVAHRKCRSRLQQDLADGADSATLIKLRQVSEHSSPWRKGEGGGNLV